MAAGSDLYAEVNSILFENLYQKGEPRGTLPFLKKTKEAQDECSTKSHLNKVLLSACTIGDQAAVERLLEKGADLNCKNINGETPLFMSLNTSDMDFVKWLVSKGASIKECVSSNGLTLLHTLIRSGDLEAVKWALEQGATVGTQAWDGYSEPHMAALSRSLEMVTFIHSRGIDMKSCSSNGSHALHIAVKQGDLEVVRFLLTLGLDPNKKTYQFSSYGDDCLHLAASKQRKAVISLLADNKAEMKSCDKCKRDRACPLVKAKWVEFVRKELVRAKSQQKSKS